MGRRLKAVGIERPNERARLAARAEPYWLSEGEGRHLGYYRGARVGRWVARYRLKGQEGYQKTTLGDANDPGSAPADGDRVLSFAQAKAKAADWFAAIDRAGGRRVGPYTVGDALDEYLAAFTGKDYANTKRRIEVVIKPSLAHLDLASLTSDLIARWHRARASTPARLRTSAKAAGQNYRRLETSEEKRRRMSTANRDLTVLKAALNKAWREGRVSSDDPWRRIRPFPNVERARLRVLSDDEARSLVARVDPAFLPMVQAALLTGARYQELAGLRVMDVHLPQSVVWLSETKSGTPRPLYLEAEGVELFKAHIAGKPAGSLVFPRPDGSRWRASQQSRPLRLACAAADIDPPACFHDLRRTYGARLAMRGVNMAVIAKALGHADERITARHYAHLAPNYVADTIRMHAGGLGIAAPLSEANRA